MTVRSRHISKSITAATLRSHCSRSRGSPVPQAALPTLGYVAYTLKVHMIQVQVNDARLLPESSRRNRESGAGRGSTSRSFGGMDLSGISDMTACQGAADFQITGPGVNLHTSLNDGDGSQDVLPATFQPNSTYVAQDNNQASVTRTSFTTTAAAAGRKQRRLDDGRLDVERRRRRDHHDGDARDPEGDAHRDGHRGGEGHAGPNKHKPVATLAPGLYKFTIADKSKKVGFVVQTSHSTTTVSTGPAVGTEDRHDQPEGRAVVLLHGEGHPEVGLHRLRGARRLACPTHGRCERG